MLDLARLSDAIRHEGGVSRRLFLAYAASLSALPLLGRRALGARRDARHSRPTRSASASRRATRPKRASLLWTRLATEPLEPSGGLAPENIEVAWEIADDESMNRVLQRGTAVATPQLGHSVHVEVDGPRAGSLVLVSLPRRRRREPDRPHADPADRRRDPARAALRLRLLPALRGRPVHRLRAHGQGRARPRVPPGRLHLRIRRRRRTSASASTSAARSCRSTTTASATRSTSPIRCCRRCTPAARGSSPGTITKSDNNYANDISEDMPTSTRPTFLDPSRQRLPGVLREHAAAGHVAAAAARICSSIASCRSVGWPNSWSSTRGNIAPTSPTTTASATSTTPPVAQRTRMLGAKQREWLEASLVESPATWNVLAQQVMMGMVDVEPGERADGTSWTSGPATLHERHAAREALRRPQDCQPGRAHRRLSTRTG